MIIVSFLGYKSHASSWRDIHDISHFAGDGGEKNALINSMVAFVAECVIKFLHL